MITLTQISEPVAGHLKAYETYLREALASGRKLSGRMLAHVLSGDGKAVRPLMVLLCAAIHGDPAKGYLPAMLVEMFHTATLIHDDVIDHSPLRRGKPSVDALWDSRRAVLLGDLILAKSFGAGMESRQYEVVSYVTRCMTALCEGELLQSEMTDTPREMTRPIYEEIIYNKTATLIGTCCGVGAMAAGATTARAEEFKRIGDLAGMAFQIKDDILDFHDATGKPLCGDLREGKVTLPLLTLLEKVSPALRDEIFDLLARAETDTLRDMIISNGGLAMAAEVMEEYVSRALDELCAACRPSPYRNSLELLFRFIADRKR